MDDSRNPSSSSPLPGAPLSSNQPPRPPAPVNPIPPQGPANLPRPANPPAPTPPPSIRPLGVPPAVQPSRPSTPSGTPVPDLRFLDEKTGTPPVSKPTVPPPLPPRPPTPPTPSPARPLPPPPPLPPRPSVPPTSTLPTRPVPPPPVRPSTAPATSAQEFKTSIRTLGSDLEKVKVGQAPSGLDIQKIITPTVPIPPSPSPLAGAQPFEATRPSRVSLGQAQRTPGLPTIPGVTSPRPLQAAPDITIAEPPPRKRSYTAFLLTILLLLLLGGGAYYYFSSPEEPIAEASPSPSPRPSPSPLKTLDNYFAGAAEPIELASSGDPALGFRQALQALALTGGQLKKLSVQSASKGAQELTPLEIFDRFLATYPSELRNYLGNDTIVVAFGQREKFDSKGILVAGAPIEARLILISEVTGIASASATITRWEPSMTQALASLLGHTPTKAATPNFLNNIYQNASVRYRNFAFPDRTIDYTLTNASNGKTYFIITNSRESVFSAIDAIKR